MDLAYANEQIYAPQSRSSTPTPQKDASSAAPNTTTTTTSSSTDSSATPKPESSQPERTDLSTELSETFKAFSATPWGARLGGFWGNVQKQSQSYYEEAVKEVEDLRVDAVKGLSSLQETIANRARSLSVEGEKDAATAGAAGNTTVSGNSGDKETTEGQSSATRAGETEADRQIRENEGFLERFRAEAAKRLRDVQRAEDAADEALLRFGTNITNFLRDAVAVSAPESDHDGAGEVLFESKDAATGKRVIHTSRLDAQLHVIHTTPSGLESDPQSTGEQWEGFQQDFDIEKKTGAIAEDLERYPELRRTMEGLVPEKVEYKDFWSRYYFLRHVLEVQEEKRRELLKASAKVNDDDEVGWDSDDDDDREDAKKPPKLDIKNANDSTTTLSQTQATPKPAATSGGLEPGRRSHDEKSVADSEASYDIVSGAPSRAANSPKEKKIEESDDEDWE